MDIIQQAATMALLTLVIYFVMVNLIDRSDIVPSSGSAQSVIKKRLSDHGNRSEAGIDNKLREPVEAPTDEPVGTGNSAVYDEQQGGVLPVNHDLFEKTPNFGSDVTNINQFYRNNPEVFDKAMGGSAYVPDVSSWNNQGHELYNKLAQGTQQGPIQGYNFEDNVCPLSIMFNNISF